MLRANRYLYEAEIRPVPAGDGRVDLEVETRDVWTLRGGVSLQPRRRREQHRLHARGRQLPGHRQGGHAPARLGHRPDLERLPLPRPEPPRQPRAQLELSYADNSDGGRQRLELESPFYSLDTRWAAGVRVMFDERDGAALRPRLMFEELPPRAGIRARSMAALARALGEGARTAGGSAYTYERDVFGPPGGLDSTSLIPRTGSCRYPWLGYQYVEDGFVTERDLDRLQTHRGPEPRHAAPLAPRLVVDRPRRRHERLIVSTRPGRRVAARRRGSSSSTSVRGSTRSEDEAENLLVGGDAALLRPQLRRERLLRGPRRRRWSHDADPESQLLLGGDTGLRGYPICATRRATAAGWPTLEQRFFSNREFFHLLHLGAAVFFDTGRAWYNDRHSA